MVVLPVVYPVPVGTLLPLAGRKQQLDQLEYLLMEDGSYLLLEDGSRIVLE